MRAGSIKISRVHFPVTTLGYGRRIGVWLQGCSIRCPGCINPDTWDFATGWEATPEELTNLVGRWLSEADGITITGGEPFDQPSGLQLLLQSLRAHFDGDVLAFSGYSHDILFAKHPAILQHLDVLITGPFDPAAGQSLSLRGSDNQRVFLLTPKATSRYPADIDSRPWEGQRHLDIFFDGDDAFMAGIPKPGFSAALHRGLQSVNLRSGTPPPQSDPKQPAFLQNQHE